MRRLTAVLFVSLALVACGNDDEEDGGTAAPVSEEATATTEPERELTDPGETMETLVRMQLLGQLGRAWDTLHPEHQELVSRSDYERCQSDRLAPMAGVSLQDFDVLETYEDRVTLPEGEVDATAVTYEMTVTDGTNTQAITDTSRLVNVDGEWRWVLSDPVEYEDC